MKLTADIGTEQDPITTMVGRLQVYGFSGTFDGCGHSIHVSITGNEEIASPFRCISSATIKNVKVTGSVSGGIHCSGLVGVALSGTCTISNCEVAVSVTCNSTHCGGIIGHGRSSNTTIENCLFSGSISGPTTTGIFYGWGDGGTHNIVNCLSAGNYTGSSGVNLARGNGIITITNCYRKTSGGSQGTDASSMTATELATKLQNNREEEVWVQDVLTNQPQLAIFANKYTVPSSGIGTFSAKANFTLPEGLEAYYCKNYDSKEGTISVERINGVVPAETGVLLRGTAGATYTLTGTNSEAATVTDNALVAVTEKTSIAQESDGYVNFGLSGGEFKKVNAAGGTVKANRAYLHILKSSLPTGAKSIALAWDGETTGIANLNVDANDNFDANAPMYNLAGQRVGKSYKGIVVVNGKKVLIK